MRVLGFHFIFSAYGFWLPNDPRGSWSHTIRQWELLRYGPATQVNTTQSVASQPHDVQKRMAAKQSLKHAPVRFTGEQARAIATGFGRAAHDAGYAIHALAIMPDHVHLVMGWRPKHIDLIAQHLKSRATGQLTRTGVHPLAMHDGPRGRVPSPWARHYWAPFIRDPVHLGNAIRYVENNPERQGLARQHWKLIVPPTL